MPRKSPGSFHLFTAFGIDVFVHWSWFVVAFIEYQYAVKTSLFEHRYWYVAVYLTLFVIVTLHEFGHALACKSVGGQAQRIILWPLGGIAFVRPPQRPGPILWSLAAGPLVNVALLPVTLGLCFLFQLPLPGAGAQAWTDPQTFIFYISLINLVLLVFNILPIYPLDGGQILQTILWFFIGRSKSMAISTVVGMICAVAGGVSTVYFHKWILTAIAIFVGYQAYLGFLASMEMAAAEAADNDRARHLAGVDQWRA